MTEYDQEPPPDEEPIGQSPPQDEYAERALLGTMMADKEAITEVVGRVWGHEFWFPKHQVVFDTIVDLYSRGEPADAVTVGNALTASASVRQVGGLEYLHTLLSQAGLAVAAAQYAEIVAERAQFRRLIESGRRIIQRGYAQEGDAASAHDAALADLMKAERGGGHQDYLPMHQLLPTALDEIEASAGAVELSGVPTGFYDLDDLTNGLHPGQMVVVAGRPATGKSTLALDFLRNAAIRRQMCSAYFSLEMSRHEIVRRTISAESRVALSKINSGMLSEQDWTRIAQHMEPIMNAPLFIDDSPNLTMTEIAAKARRLRAQENLQVMVIDYMQLMSSGRRVESRQVEVSEFSRLIKLLAKELEVPVVVLSQLNRGVEQRASKRPMLSDLRESGSIEQDADLVILMHREDMYEAESNRPGEADLIVAKHRNGPLRDLPVVAQLHFARFVDMAAN